LRSLPLAFPRHCPQRRRGDAPVAGNGPQPRRGAHFPRHSLLPPRHPHPRTVRPRGTVRKTLLFVCSLSLSRLARKRGPNNCACHLCFTAKRLDRLLYSCSFPLLSHIPCACVDTRPFMWQHVRLSATDEESPLKVRKLSTALRSVSAGSVQLLSGSAQNVKCARCV